MSKVNLNILVAVCVLIMALAGPAGAVTLYVDPNGSADFTTIQEAINTASDYDEIEVAPGTYNETINFNGKAVKLYSSGGQDVTTINAGGSDHVVLCVNGEGANTTLEGFTITGGNTTYGGGMYNNGTSPTVTNCTFTENDAGYGGGMLNNNNSNPNLTNCTFEFNGATDWGGGMYNNEGSSPTVTNCTFTDNSSAYGGGMFNRNSNPDVNDCTFEFNSATDWGGGMYNVDNSSPTARNCTFTSNSANYGGGMFNRNSNPNLTDCNFNQNIAATYGGGMENYISSSPTVTNCTFTDNCSAYGGGMFNNNSSPNLTDCTFTYNAANNYGGGMENFDNSSPTVTNCTFTWNTADAGGGMFNNNSSPDVNNCTFTHNATSLYGGGMENLENSSPTVTNCTFKENTSVDNGGGMYNHLSSPVVTNCEFLGNTTENDGGGMSNYGYVASPIVTNCVFFDNYAEDDGGGMSSAYCSLTVTNCTFTRNTTGGGSNSYGGGMLNLENNPNVTNCTFTGNNAGYGGGMYNLSSSPTVTNCILWGDTPDEIFGGSPTVTYSDVQGGWVGADGNNIDADPLFVGAAGGDLRLRDCSPCVDAGNSAAVPPGVTKDISGKDRFVDDVNIPDTGSGPFPIVDMGAYERQPGTPGFKVRNVTRGKNYCSIQDAIADANNGDEIEVTPGTYYESINFNRKAVRLYSSGGPEVTTIDGDGAYHVVQCVNDEGPDTILEGFTITGGDANGPGPEDKRGGGMYCESSSPSVINCIFTDNSATDYGGGMYNITNSSPTVINCTFTGNTASSDTYGGGGMFNDGSSPTVTNCTFTGNTAATDGAGMYNYGSSSAPTMTNCILWGDTPDEIYEYSSTTIVTYSDVQGGWGDPNDPNNTNINADPLFVDAASGNLRLRWDSPCIDAGNNGVPYLPATDLAGSQRIEDGDWDGNPVIDIGALEFKVTTYEITVLTYNTHLFRKSPIDEFCTTWPYSYWCDRDDFVFQDWIRHCHIACKVEESGADIVALQEVWAWSTQLWFVNRLKETYPFELITISGCQSFYGETQGNGLVLLSKFPLSDVGFKRFPTYTYSELPENDDCWANKGVLTATVDTGYKPVRIGISHALTGYADRKSEWSPDYRGTGITTFDFNGQPYIFALTSDSNQAYITRIDDYSYHDEQDPNQFMYGAGWMHIYDDFWDSNYLAVVSFELNGHPYLFGLKSDSNQTYITRINDDPSTGWNHSEPYYSPWDKDYRSTTLTSFQLNGEAYIFGQKSTGNQARITRINTDPCTGELDSSDPFEDLGLFPCGSNYSAVVSFELNGHPYLFGLTSGYDEAWTSRINDDPSTGWTDVYHGPWGRQYVPTAITSFQLNGHPYIFGLATNDQAWITRINEDPSTGLTDVYGGPWDSDYSVAIKSFQMNGHPYLFALNGCCAQYDDVCGRQRPGEADLCRINNDPSTGLQFVYQMEDIKIIRDATVAEDGLQAIMMGDFNVHLSKYGVMDNIFEKAGAVDAYIQVHGDNLQGGETIDLLNNKLFQEFCKDSDNTPYNDCDCNDPNAYPIERTFDRIDYVYVTPSGTGFELVPTEAHVIRDWKYDDVEYAKPDMDLSDHYPLIVKFRIRRPVDFNDDSKIDFNDLAMLVSSWLAESGDPLWDVNYNLNVPPDDVVNFLDFAVFAESWLVGAE